MNLSDKKTIPPLIDRILIIGVSQEDVTLLFSKRLNNTQLTENLKSIKIKILDEYKSNELREQNKENYKENIPTFCMPNGIIISETPSHHQIHSFSLITSSAKRKHCTCLTFYEPYEIKEKPGKIFILKAICMVSSRPIYGTHKELLNNFHSIQLNHKEYRKNNSEQLNYIYLRDKSKSYTVLKEYSVLEFYFAFILNSLKHPKEEASFYINYIGNNMGKKCFLKYFTNSKQSFPLVDYDTTKLLDQFNIEDLIKIYMALLMEYKLILVFEDYETINNLIFSLVNLLFPLKWKFPIISFISPSLIDTLEAPFGIIIGLHSDYLNILNDKISQELMVEETLIYNLQNKSFIFFPKIFPEFPLKILNELRSSIYMVLSEKLSLTTELENEDAELFKIFPTNSYKKIDPILYLNLKINQVFFNVFLELVKNLESSLYFNKIKSIKSNERVQIHEIFDATKFINDRDFLKEKKYVSFVEQFSRTIMFLDFVEKYIRQCDSNPRYNHIKNMLTTLNTKQNGKSIIKDINREYIKNKILAYYNFKYISLEEALKFSLEYFKNKNRQIPISGDIAWPSLDNKKVTNFVLNYDKLIMKESDEKIKENYYRKLFFDLSRFKDFKHCKYFYFISFVADIISEEDISIDHLQHLNIREMKTKSNIENINKGSRNFFNPKYHKQSTSLNMESELNTSILNNIIKTENKIENYYFNNINISSDQFNKRIGINLGMAVDNNNKLINSNSQNPSYFSIGQSVNSLRNLSSTGNSLTNSGVTKEGNVSVSAFSSDLNGLKNNNNYTTTNKASDNNNIKVNKKVPYQQINLLTETYKKKKDPTSSANKVGEILKGFKIIGNKNKYTAETDVANSSLIQNQVNKEKSGKQLINTNMSVKISPFKQPRINHTNHKNSVSIGIDGVINKLKGDDMAELFFSGNEEEN